MWSYRGDEFRKTFAELGSIRSLLPSNVNVLALTATATRETLKCVISRISMKNPVIIGLPPDRPNIKLSVYPCPTILRMCEWLAKELLEKRTAALKTVVFCRSLRHCADMCVMMKKLLRENITEPPGLPDNIVQYRLVDVFTAASDADMKEEILAEFCKRNSNLRLLIATTAFGLGVDCMDTNRIINYGTPSTLEELVQELGRAGRDGSPAEAILYHKVVGKKITDAATAYGTNQTVCRQSLLFKEFLFSKISEVHACRCCDICEPLCNCEKCHG